MSETVILFLVSQIVTAAGIYAAIRADLREHKVRIGILEKNFDKTQECQRAHV